MAPGLQYSCPVLVLPLLLVLSVGTVPLTGDPCTDQLAACHKPLTKYHNITHFAIFDAESDTEVQEICSEYKHVQECVNSIKHKCPRLTQKQYEGYDGVYDYICYEGRETYLKVRMCLRRRDLIQQAGVCNTTFQHNLVVLGYYSGNYQDRVKKTCTYVDTYLDCVHMAVEKHCGTEAADWQEEVDKRALQPLLDEVGCTEKSTYWWLPVAIITPIVIALAAATFCIIMHLRKGTKPRQRQPRRHHTGMHYHAENPGYAGGQEGAVYPIVNPGVPVAIGGEKGKGGELPPEFLQLPPYMNDPPPEYTEIVGDGSGSAAAVGGYAPLQSSYDDTRSVMSGKSGKSHKSHMSRKSDKSSHRSRADDLQSVRSDGGRSSASTAYPQSARPNHPPDSQYDYAGYQPTDGGFM